MHVKEPRTLIVKEKGLAPVFLDSRPVFLDVRTTNLLYYYYYYYYIIMYIYSWGAGVGGEICRNFYLLISCVIVILFLIQKSRKSQESTFKRPEGMHREVYALLYSDKK